MKGSKKGVATSNENYVIFKFMNKYFNLNNIVLPWLLLHSTISYFFMPSYVSFDSDDQTIS